MYFEAWIESMKPRGWKGIVGRSPTELEMVDALTNYDLVVRSRSPLGLRM
jgi:separase